MLSRETQLKRKVQELREKLIKLDENYVNEQKKVKELKAENKKIVDKVEKLFNSIKRKIS